MDEAAALQADDRAADAGVHDVQRYEKGVVFRFGRLLPEIRGPDCG